MTESEAQRWVTLGAAARLNWLVRVGKAAIQGCEAIWATATKVWATRENNLRIARCPRQAIKTRRQIRRSVALALQLEDKEALRKSPLVRFNR